MYFNGWKSYTFPYFHANINLDLYIKTFSVLLIQVLVDGLGSTPDPLIPNSDLIASLEKRFGVHFYVLCLH